jgi:predicted RNase H-related nuclease YkuK (DUF458 family)
MDRQFKRLDTKEDVDIVDYLKSKLRDTPDAEIYIGCDSQTQGRKTTYAIVVVLHYRGAGGHVMYTKETMPKVGEIGARLWKEVEFSVELAEHLLANGVKKAKYIDIDINPDKKYKSNILLTSAMGFVAWKGFEPRAKPYAVSASRVADKLCK